MEDMLKLPGPVGAQVWRHASRYDFAYHDESKYSYWYISRRESLDQEWLIFYVHSTFAPFDPLNQFRMQASSTEFLVGT